MKFYLDDIPGDRFFLGSCYRMVFNLNLPSLANSNFQTHLVVTGLLPDTSLLTCAGHFCSVLLATIQVSILVAIR